MARPCTVCTSPMRLAIDAELLAATGASMRDVAATYGVGLAALGRHKTAHLHAAIGPEGVEIVTKRREKARAERAERAPSPGPSSLAVAVSVMLVTDRIRAVADRLDPLIEKAAKAFDTAIGAGEYAAAGVILRELRGLLGGGLLDQLRLEAEVTGQIGRPGGTKVDVRAGGTTATITVGMPAPLARLSPTMDELEHLAEVGIDGSCGIPACRVHAPEVVAGLLGSPEGAA